MREFTRDAALSGRYRVVDTRTGEGCCVRRVNREGCQSEPISVVYGRKVDRKNSRVVKIREAGTELRFRYARGKL